MFEYFPGNYPWSLAVMGALNRGGQNPLWQAEKLFAGAVNSPGRKLKVFTLAEGAAEHCQADNGSMAVDCITDWVAEVLGGNPKGI